MNNQISCPHCGKKVSVDEVMGHQIKESLEMEFEARLKKEKEELQEQIQEKNKRLEESRKLELDLRKQRSKLEDDQKELELTVQRKLDEQRIKIQQDVQRQITDEYRLKEQEKEKTISDLKKALEDAKHRAEQGSQQLQGEILELDLEEVLKLSFPQDTIAPVAKGTKGGDLVQTVRSPSGSTDCGQILWEIKRTKNWTDSWISKLKSDKRQAKANIAAIVTTALPGEAQSGLGLKDGIWVCSYLFVVPLSSLLRKALLDSAYQKAAASHQGRKADLIYEYITGHQFQQQIEGLIEVYKEMQEQVTKERAAFERSWKAREGQLQRFILSTANIYGSMQGLAGSQALPQLKGLSLELDQGETESETE